VKRGAAWLAGLALLAPSLLPLAPPARAAEEEASAEEVSAEEVSAEEGPVDLEKLHRERTARAGLYPVRRRISRYLEAATKAVDAGKPEDGRALLDKLDVKRLNPFERALVYRLHAHLAYFGGDHAAARENFEKVLAEKILPIREDNRIRFNIAQLYASSQQWDEVIKALDRWARYVDEPDPFVHYLRAVAYYQLENFDAALAEAKRAVELSPEPLESWLLILSALYTQKEQYANAVPVLEQLVSRFPSKKRYWIQLALIFGALENYPRALSLQELAYRQGLLTEDKELRRLARASLHQNLPYPAAQVLERALADGAITRDSEALELLANSWIAAREYERSLPPLRQAAELAKNGNLYVRLGQVYMQREAWEEAAEVLQQAIAKGDLKDPGNAQLLLGIAYYNDQRVDQARSSFARARQHDSTREAADRWISHLESGGGTAG
jgi:tetratricopeptide (TPR) repeat protein